MEHNKNFYISQITEFVKTQGGYLPLSTFCKPFVCVRFNDFRQRYELKCQDKDTESWEDIKTIPEEILYYIHEHMTDNL